MVSNLRGEAGEEEVEVEVEEVEEARRAGDRVGVVAEEEGRRLRAALARRASGLVPPTTFARLLESGGRVDEVQSRSKTRKVSTSCSLSWARLKGNHLLYSL